MNKPGLHERLLTALEKQGLLCHALRSCISGVFSDNSPDPDIRQETILECVAALDKLATDPNIEGPVRRALIIACNAVWGLQGTHHHDHHHHEHSPPHGIYGDDGDKMTSLELMRARDEAVAMNCPRNIVQACGFAVDAALAALGKHHPTLGG